MSSVTVRFESEGIMLEETLDLNDGNPRFSAREFEEKSALATRGIASNIRNIRGDVPE